MRCQLFAADGRSIGAEFQVNTTASERHPEPAVAPLAEGGFVVGWHSYRPDDDKADVWAQRFGADGRRLGSELRVNSYTKGYQQRCSVASLVSGGFAVCWQRFQQDGWEDGPFAQLFAADGSRLGPELQLHTSLEGDEDLVQGAALTNGGFVAWQRFWASGSEVAREDILIQCFDGVGNKTGTETRVSATGAAPFAKPAVAGLHDGSVVVCWAAMPYRYQQDILARRCSPGGSVLGPEFCINAPAQNVFNLEPDIATLNNGDFLVCWRRCPCSSGNGVSKCDIFARQFAPDGAPRGPEFRVNTHSELALQHNMPAVAAFADSGLVICWQIGPGRIKAEYFPADSVSMERDTPAVAAQGLLQSVPNPFNSSTPIHFVLPATQEMVRAKVTIYHRIGRVVKVLVDGAYPSGHHCVVWEGADAAGRPASSGVYFCRIEADGLGQTMRILLLK